MDGGSVPDRWARSGGVRRNVTAAAEAVCRKDRLDGMDPKVSHDVPRRAAGCSSIGIVCSFRFGQPLVVAGAGLRGLRMEAPRLGQGLEKNLQAELNVARIARVRKLPEVRCYRPQAIGTGRGWTGDACVGVGELRVIEDVEAFKPELCANTLA